MYNRIIPRGEVKPLVRKIALLLSILLTMSHASSGSVEQASLVLAVSDFTGDNPALCQAATEIVLTDLAKSRKLTLVERAQLRQALSELRLQRTGLTEPGQMARAGKLTGATHVVVGSVSVNEQRVILNARVLDARTGALYAGVAENTEGWIDELFALAHDLANRLHHRLTGEPLPGFAEPFPSTPAEPTPVEDAAPRPATPAPDWENLPESPAIAHVLMKGWMRLFADGSFRPYELVTERYFYETLRRLARRYNLDDSRLFPTGEGTGTVSRLAATRAMETLITGRTTYFLEIPVWCRSWLRDTPQKPLNRAQFAQLLVLAEAQLQRRITPSTAAPSVPAAGH
jgi:TolB-like protein